MNWNNVFYLVGTIFFVLFSFVLLVFFYISISTYLKLKSRIDELKDKKLLYSAFKKAIANPKSAILPLVGFLTALFLKFKREEKLSL